MALQPVMADPANGLLPSPVLVALADDVVDPGTVIGSALAGAFAAKVPLSVNVLDFGAVGDGTTDDTAAFSAAIDYVNAQNAGVVDAANVIGTSLRVPTGRYKITGPVNPILKSGCDIVGDGNNGSVLLLSYNGATFAFGNGSSDLIVGGSVSNLKIEYLAAPGASAVAFHVEYASRLSFENILMVNVGTLANLGASAARYASSIEFSFIRGYVYNSGKAMIRANYGAGVSLTNCRVFVGGVGAPIIDRTSTMTTVAGTNVVNVNTGSWDTVHMTGCFFERFYYGLYVSVGSGKVVNNVFIDNTYFDYHRQSAVLFEALTGGFAGGLNISNSWVASWEDTGITLRGPGVVRGVSICNLRVSSAGTHGILIGAAVVDVSIADSQIAGTNRTNVNAMGILNLGGSHVTISNVLAGYDSTWAGFAWQAYNGIYLIADNDYVTVTGCDCAGTAGGFTLEANASGSVNRLVWGNRGANYSGYSALTLAASTVANTNKTATVWDVSIHGGTVTVIAKNGTTITGMTSGTIRIAPGETFTVTYSSVPSVTRFVQA